MSHSDNLVLQTAGVNDVWHYTELHLDSSARDAGTNDEPEFILPIPIHDVMGFKVLSAEIPFSYYLVHDHNSLAEFYVNYNGTVQTHSFNIPNGSYGSPEELAKTWQDLINANVNTSFQYVVDFRPTSGTFAVYAQTSNGTRLRPGDDPNFHGLLFRFPTGPNGESCGPIFGCFPGRNYGSVHEEPADHPPGSLYEVHTELVNLTGPNYLQLFSNLGNQLSNKLLVNGSSTSSPPVIARIPVNAGPFEIITYKDPNPGYLFDTSLSQLQNVQLSLRLGRDENHPLALNNQPWSVVLMVLSQRETTAGRHVYPSDGRNPNNKRIRVR